MSTLPGNTIDFDSARLKLRQAASTASRGVPPPRPVTLLSTRQELAQSLQTSLEVDRVLEIFFGAIRKLMGVDGLAYRNETSGISLILGTQSLHRCSYRITHSGDYLGELQFSRSKRFGENQLASVESLIGSLLYPLRNALLYREAVNRALSDALTLTGNRLALAQSLEREIQLALRNRTPLSMIVADIDHFKSINDQYGHAYGDEALKAMANCSRGCLRAVDSIFRLGGEEFVILLQNTDAEAALIVAERIRDAVENMQFTIDGGAVPMTVSLGVATRQHDETARELLDRCDRLMYRAKASGRNCVAGV